MIKKHPLGYSKGMSQDLSKSLTDNSTYFSAMNIRVLATDEQSSFALTNEAGNELMFAIPAVTVYSGKTQISYTNVDTTGGASVKSLRYTRTGAVPGCEIEDNYTPGAEAIATSGDQIIVGTVDTRDGAIIATTDNNGWDCIWELSGLGSGDFVLNLKYLNNLGFSTATLLQLLYNYENSKIEKIYIVDGAHQLRFMNLRQSTDNGDLINLIDNKSDSVNTVSKIDISQPTISSVISGGDHLSGMVQYAYNLYVLNGAQTTLSPLSELVSIDNGPGLGGGEVNENLGRTVMIKIDGLDEDYTHVKLYVIKYTSYNQSPEISLIADREIDDNRSLSYADDGNVKYAISTTEFAFLGSTPKVPKHIESKDSRLFLVNVKEKDFSVDIDTRLYGHANDQSCRVWQNIVAVNGGSYVTGDVITVNTTTYNVPKKHDSVNKDYSIYNRAANGSDIGVEGKYFRLLIDQETMSDEDAVNNQFLKDREIYRFAIEFFNNLGQTSDPYWMADVQAPSGNLEGNYNKVRFEIKPEFTTWLSSTEFGENEKPVGYRILRADRTLSDRTILAQGMINPMVANSKNSESKVGGSEYMFKEATAKMPSITRVFPYPEGTYTTNAYLGPIREIEDGRDTSDNGYGEWSFRSTSETINANDTDDYRAQTCQFSRMMQMYTPELLFSSLEIDPSYQLDVIGMATQTALNNWSSEMDPNTLVKKTEAKFFNGYNSYQEGVTVEGIEGEPSYLMDVGFYGPTNEPDLINTHQVFREFLGDFIPSTVVNTYDMYGSPEISSRGAEFKEYNGDGKLRYSNHLLSQLQDDWRDNDEVNNDSANQILGCNAIGSSSIVFVEGPDEKTFDLSRRKKIEDFRYEAGITENAGVLMAEFKKPVSQLYLGNIYGGNSYEAKASSTYIRIGEYRPIDEDSIITSPGDTFVQDFTFTKFSKSDEQNSSRAYTQLTEIVSYKTETTIDLKNRNDISIGEWDNNWQPKYIEYQKYNRVYSQQTNLLVAQGTGFKFKKISEYDTRIVSTKVKIPGEDIDSWTDFLENETMDLDGKYGPINATLNYKDEIFLFQDNAVAHVSINPRVQTIGSDGVAVELGSGTVLHDYQYLTTKSGCLNKRGVAASESGFYYFDLNNKSIMVSNGQGVQELSEQKGFHSFFANNIGYDDLLVDNPVIDKGVSIGYNSNNNEVYFTFLQKTFYNSTTDKTATYSNDFTICYNENIGVFTSFYGYTPAWYINKGSRMITTGLSSKSMWDHFKGERGVFYGSQHSSEVVFNVRPQQGSGNYTFNNVSYKMEMKDSNGVDLPNETFNYVRLKNEYQNTNFKPIVIRKNAKRRFRDWSITLPRAEGTRDRIKSPWALLALRMDNRNDYRMVSHNLVVSYTEY
tara:strand:- start:28 stop:4152 length:4125 start_codon:yes stop_codon:yes gene_type:complete